MAKSWNLVPFSKRNEILEVQVRRVQSALELVFHLKGDLNQIVIPPPVPVHSRKDLLWQHTCLEAFLSLPGSSEYWEINLSPSGEWNCYRFKSYREGQEIENRIQDLRSRIQEHSSSALKIAASLDLKEIFPPAQPIELGLTAVIEDRSGERSYWALQHLREKPDFHVRESFSARIL